MSKHAKILKSRTAVKPIDPDTIKMHEDLMFKIMGFVQNKNQLKSLLKQW